MEFKVWLIVQILTNAGFTQFHVEYPDLAHCQIAMVHTAALQALHVVGRTVRLECREWPLPKAPRKRGYKA